MNKVIVLICLFILSSCASIVGQDFNLGSAKHIRNGETTKSELMLLFGEPREKEIKNNNIEIWKYYYMKSTEKITGRSDNHSKILIIQLNNGIVVNFDKLEKFENDVY